MNLDKCVLLLVVFYYITPLTCSLSIKNNYNNYQNTILIKNINKKPLKILLISLISSLSFNINPGLCQIPTFDEYNTGSGTLIKPKISSKSAQRDSTKIISSNNKFNKILLKNTLYNIKKLISNGLWDDILLEIKNINFINKKNYGLEMKNLNEQIESSREELRYVIGQISDLCLASRVIYFNIEDLKGVQLLSNDKTYINQDAIKEGIEYIDNAINLFNELIFDFE